MFQQLLFFFPDQASNGELIAVMFGALLGIVLWVAGARYHRPFITLLTVFLGGMLGMILPRQFHWDINTMATAVGGAMVLGLSGYIFHRIWLGITFTALLVGLAALGAWLMNHGTTPLAWPSVTGSLREVCDAFWDGLPEEVCRPMPFVTSAAALAAVSLTIFAPRFARVAHYSTLGACTLLAMALCEVQSRKIDWPAFLPTRTDAQILLVCGMVATGIIVQWNILPMKRSEPAKADAGA